MPLVPGTDTSHRGAAQRRHKYADAVTRRDWLTTIAAAACAAARAPAAGYRTSQPPGDDVDPTQLSIAQLQAAFASGRLTPLDVTATYLERIDRENPALGAFITVTRERAVDDTRRLLTRATARAASTPLSGVPIAHKDLFATRGIRTTGGSRLHERWVPERDAAVVARLAAAGTVLLGKTNTHELGGGVTTINPFFGTTRNPRDTSRIAGGSSGGSAAAVAARLVLAATGSDTGGSIRIPAALCGCVGLKPTYGVISTDGLLGACPTFDHVGLLTRSVADMAPLLLAIADDSAALSGLAPTTAAAPTGGPPYAAARGLRIGVPRPYFFERLEPGVERAANSTLDRLRRAGAEVRDVALPIEASLFDTMFGPIVADEVRATYAHDWATRPGAFSKDFAGAFLGPAPTRQDVARARDARATFERTVTALFADVDVLAMPTVPVVAPRIDGPLDGGRILRNTWPFNAARGPALSVPCGVDDAGLPVGLQLVGAPLAEGVVLRAAAAVEAL
jgi:aspartyl-tRNA(Asn)/glutamyl-tRNA(Gln) amidotransferase subunit A